MKSSLFLYLFWLLLTSSVIPCSAGPSDAILDIGNGLMELGFDRSTGRLLIIRDHVHLHDYLEAGMAGNSLWRFVLSSSDGLDILDMESGSYDEHHGHPPGGGNFWNESFVHFTRLIRSKLDPADQPILTGDGTLELRIPDLDAFLTLQVSRERYMGQEEWETIPFFQAVYHPYAITYGNYSSLVIPSYDELWPEECAPEEPQKLLDRGFQKQFLIEQARSFVWGMQPTIAKYRSSLLSEREEEMAYVLKLARVRNRALKYLLHGEFLRSPLMEIPEEGIRLSRLSIYKGREEHSMTTFYKKVPMVHPGTWRSDDGGIGIALASIGNDPYHVRSVFPCRDYELPPSGRIYMIDARGRILLSEYQEGMVRLDFTLGPKDLCLVEIVSDK